MKIESIYIKNYKVLKDVKIEAISHMTVFLGENGSGKTTLFDVFGFLKDCLIGNVKSALAKRGGFKEVLSRDCEGPISFEIKFRNHSSEPLITYKVSIDLDCNGNPVVSSEVLQYRRGENGAPWKFIDFKNGAGDAIINEVDIEKITQAVREPQKLQSPDILAIKGLGQFEKFKSVAAFRSFIEEWQVSDFNVDAARIAQNDEYSEQLNQTADNLANVAKYMYENYPQRFNKVTEKMSQRIPGVRNVEAKTTEDGRLVLRFQDGKFKDPFIARFVSDGTMKMFAYLILLNSPIHKSLLCIEEPENQLYPKLLEELAEEFRQYAQDSGQVFISTHSPDLVNAAELDELYCLRKKDGFTTVVKAKDIANVKELIALGDKPGELWKQGFFDGEIRA